jgi:hypothetical protein
VKAQHPELWARYSGIVEPDAKTYGRLTGLDKKMLELVNDSTKTKRLATHAVDVYAKCWAGIDDSGPMPQECLASYQAAVQKVLRASPNLAAAYQSGPYRFGGLGVVGIVGFVGHLGRTRLLYLGFCPNRVGSERNHVRWPGARNVVMSSSPQPILKLDSSSYTVAHFHRATLALFTESAVFHAPRHEDFQSSYRTETMCHHRSLFVSIQAFNAAPLTFILPIRTHSGI